jgi:hypothetical protein
MAGWIKLHRSLLDWEWYSEPNTARVFMHLLLTANYEEGRFMGEIIPVGACVTGRLKLAQTLGLSERCVRTAIERLKISQQVTIKSLHKFSIITITNWAEYQQDDQPTTSQRPASDHPNDQPTTTLKEGKKERKNNNPIIPLPDGVTAKTFDDFMLHRKAKRAPVTQTAMEGIEREAGKAGMTLEAALLEILNRGWVGFKAEWIKRDQPQAQQHTGRPQVRKNAITI